MPSTAISISRYSRAGDRLDPNSTTRFAWYFRASCSIIFLSVSVIIGLLYHFDIFKSIRANEPIEKACFAYFPTRKYLILLVANLRKMTFPTDSTDAKVTGSRVYWRSNEATRYAFLLFLSSSYLKQPA